MSVSAAVSGTQKTLAIRPSQRFEGHTHWVRGVIHLLGGQRIMTCSDDGSLRVWNLKTGEQIRDPWRDGENRVLAIALSLDGKKVVCGGAGGAVNLWDIDTGKIIAKWTGHTNYVTSLCWNRDCGRVVSGSRDGTARVWDVESGKTVLAIETGPSQLEAVIYSPDMTMIATAGRDSEDLKEFIKIWDAKTGKLITNLKGHRESVSCLAWTADGSTLISGSEDYSIRTWNTTTWQQIHVLKGHTSCVISIAISPNVPILASASWDDTARLWNLENGQPIGSPLHPRGVICVSFSTGGTLLATGCCDNNTYSWDISGILEEDGLLNQNVSGPFLISLYQPNHDALSQDGDKSLIDVCTFINYYNTSHSI
jgi:WD40 repeat protein